MAKGHSKYPVEKGQPYSFLPFPVNGQPRGEMYLAVTSVMAKDFLAHSKGNRRIRDEYVAKLAREMRAGLYNVMTRGKPFKFDEEGYLRDGHHTAFAILLASQDEDEVLGVESVPAGVIWGMTEREARMLDTNVDRTYTDVLHVDGLAHGSEIAPMVRASIAWERGYYTDRGHFRASTDELDARYRDKQDAFDRAIELARPILKAQKGIMVPAALRFHLYLLVSLGDAADETLGEWTGYLASDENTWIRENIVKQLTEAKTARTRTSPYIRYGYQLGLMNEAWNRFASGNTKSKIQLGSLTGKINSKNSYPIPEI